MSTPQEYQRRFNTSGADLAADFQTGLDRNRERAAQLQGDLNTRIRAVSERRDLTDDAKRTAAARLHVQAKETLQRMLADETARIEKQRRALERKAFGHQGTADASTNISRRDAAARADALDNPGDAAAALRRAERAGDETSISPRPSPTAPPSTDGTTSSGSSPPPAPMPLPPSAACSSSPTPPTPASSSTRPPRTAHPLPGCSLTSRPGTSSRPPAPTWT